MDERQRKYVPVFFDWPEVTQDLTNEERGILINALVMYASGEEYEHLLSGVVKVAFRFLKGQYDRFSEISEKRRTARAGNGEKETTDNKPEQPTTNDNKPEQTGTKMRNNSNSNSNSNNNSNSNSNSSSSSGFIEPEAAAEISQDQNEVLDEAARAGFPQTNIVRDNLIALFADYGKDRLLTGIHECAEHNGTNLAYLRAVLKGGKKHGKHEDNGRDNSGKIQSAYSFLNNRTAV